jgi:hypothetical protein
MDWTQLIVFTFAMAGFFLIGRSDLKAIEAKIQSDRQTADMKIQNDHNSMLAIIIAIKDEIKDFHGRLCALEEKKKLKEEK